MTRLAALALALGLAAGLLAVPGVAAAAPSPEPLQLSITIDNGREAVDAGDELPYTVTVTNLGGSKVKDLVVTQTVPAGARVVSGPAGSTLRWRVDVPAGGAAKVRSRLRLVETPDALLRFATVACAARSPKGPPTVCASDSDLLPAGAAAAEAPAAVETTPRRRPAWYAVGGAAALAALLGGLAVRARSLPERRRPAS